MKWQTKWNAILGRMPDCVLAERWGIAAYTVHRHRKAAGIKAYKGKRPIPCGWCGKDAMRYRNHQDVACDRCKDAKDQETARKWRAKHSEWHVAYLKEWKKQNREHFAKWKSEWNAKNPKRLAEYRRRSREKKAAARAALRERAIEVEIRGSIDHFALARCAE